MSKRVLVAPLDWGLGHATRCIPIIRALLARGCTVLLAGSGESLQLLQSEFPQLSAFTLTGYRPRYPARGSMVLAMARQLPKFIRAIRREHRETEALVQAHHIDLVIADNRYGCHTRLAPCILITHQSNILMPAGFGWLAPGVRWLNVHFLKKFSACWVPDEPGGLLSGDLLGFGKTLGEAVPYQFTGVLSRFHGSRFKVQGSKFKVQDGDGFQGGGDQGAIIYDVVAVCSGPEPQRSIFEALVTAQLERSGLVYVIVRGAPGGEREHVRGLLGSAALEKLMKQARIIVARSGYSTLMDLVALGKQAILIPTPGQTEQEYLAGRLKEQGIAYTVAQDQFDLGVGLEESKNYRGFTGVKNDGRLELVIEQWLTSVQGSRFKVLGCRVWEWVVMSVPEIQRFKI